MKARNRGKILITPLTKEYLKDFINFGLMFKIVWEKKGLNKYLDLLIGNLLSHRYRFV